MLTKEQLLEPCYKVIADYPGNDEYAVGSIVTNIGENYCEFLNQYPHLFKKLEWWEDRTKSELPKYVKNKVWVKKVDEWLGVTAHFNKNRRHLKDIAYMATGEYLPATKEEYDKYQQDCREDAQ